MRRNVEMPGARFERVRRLLLVGIVFIGAAFIAWSWRLESLAIPLTPYRVDDVSVRMMGVGVLLLGAIELFVSIRLVTTTFFTLASVLVLFTAGQLQSEKAGDSVVSLTRPKRILVSKTEWIGRIDGKHPKYGVHHIPRSHVHHHTIDFDVDYTIDDEGWRKIPQTATPTSERPIVFLGCSFAFGQGVSDHETFTAVLAKEAWPSFKVLNCSCRGWGTTNMFLALEDQLEASPKPRCVVLTWLTLHHRRNYLRRSWHYKRSVPFPHFELDKAGLTYQGLKPHTEATLEDSPELTDEEFEISLRLIEEMHRRCAAAGVPFVVVKLQDRDIDKTWEQLRSQSTIPIMDLSRFGDEVHPNDYHPTPRWHRTIAAAIAGDPLLAELTGEPALHCPGVIEAPFAFDCLRLSVLANHSNVAVLEEIEPRWVRIDLALADLTPWFVRASRRHLPVVKGKDYVLELEARADGRRLIHPGMSRGHAPFRPLSKREELELTPQWQSFRLPFQALETCEDAAIDFLVASSSLSLEIRNDRLLDANGDEVIPVVPANRP